LESHPVPIETCLPEAFLLGVFASISSFLKIRILFFRAKARRRKGIVFSFSPPRWTGRFIIFHPKAQRPARRGGRKEILIPSEAVDRKIYFFLAKAQFRIRRGGLCDLAALRD
jgi:hypothetical protein